MRRGLFVCLFFALAGFACGEAEIDESSASALGHDHGRHHRDPCRVHHGDVVINSRADAWRLRCLRAIDGDLTISTSAALSHVLPHLTRVSGDVLIEARMGRRFLNALETIGGHLIFGSGASETRHSGRHFTHLTAIGGDLRLLGTTLRRWPINNGSTPLAIGGGVTITDNARLAALDADLSLTASAHLSLHNNPLLSVADICAFAAAFATIDLDPALPCGGGGLVFERITGEDTLSVSAIRNDVGPALDDLGTVVFAAESGTGPDRFFVASSGTVTEIDIASHQLETLNAFQLDNSGHIGISGRRTVASAPLAGAYSIGTDGTGFTTLHERDLSMLDPLDPAVSNHVAVSPNGTIAFSSIRDGHGAIWRGPIAGPVTELRSGTGTFFNTLVLDVNNSGAVAVQMEYSDPTAGLRRGILMFETVNPALAAINTAIEKLGIGVQPAPAINASGQVAFALSGAVTLNFWDPPNDTSGTLIPVSLSAGVYVSTPTLFGALPNLTQIVDADAGPFDTFRKVTINDSGLVLFEATLDTPIGWGTYSGPDPVADKVLAAGDTIGARLFSDVHLGDLNNAGQAGFVTTDFSTLTREVWRVSGLH